MEIIGFFIKLSFLFIFLLAVTHLVYHRFLHSAQPTVLSGSFIMGTGAYLWLCFPEFRLPHFVMQIAVLELAIIWVYMILGMAQQAIDGRLNLEKRADRLSLGIWVVGTAIVGLLVDKVEPLLHGSILFMALVVLILGAAYFIFIGKWLITYLSTGAKSYVNSIVLCATITIQMCVWFEIELFQHPLPVWLYQSVIMLGLLFYAVSYVGLMKYFLFVRRKYRFICFLPRSTLIYSSTAVTGLVVVLSHAFSDLFLSIIWYWTVIMFFAVESIELNRFMLAIKKKGFSSVMMRYESSQWIRIFSFAMFYAFALTHYHANTEVGLFTFIMFAGLYSLSILFILQCAVAWRGLYKEKLRLTAA